VDQAADPTSHPAEATRLSHAEELLRQQDLHPHERAYLSFGDLKSLRHDRQTSSTPRRNGGRPLAVPVPFSSLRDRAEGTPQYAADPVTLGRLKTSIQALESRSPRLEPGNGMDAARHSDRWTLGAPEADALLGATGLDLAGLHEIKPALPDAGASWDGSMGAALAFSLMLVVRRLADCAMQADPVAARQILWCWTSTIADDIGRLYGPGFKSLGIDPNRLILAETARETDVLWSLDEGLKSGCLALVVGVAGELDLTPARRLALAAQAGATPALLLTGARTPSTAATATRWRVKSHPSAPHPADARAPGAVRLSLFLERCRNRPATSSENPLVLEWSDEAYRFRMAPGAADRADAEKRSRARAR